MKPEEEMRIMKTSRYNIFIPTDESKRYILYNSIYRSVIKVHSKLKDTLNNSVVSRLSRKKMNKLKEYGVVVPKNLNELQMAKVKYQREKFSRNKLTFIILPTFECNLACTYCYQGGNSKLNGTMSNEVLLNTKKFILDKIHQYQPRVFSLGFFGGEPFVAEKKLFQLITQTLPQLPSDLKKNISIVSNATLLKETTIEKLEELTQQNKNTEVTLFTTLAGNKKIHNKKRTDGTTKGTYNQVYNSLQKLKKSSINVSVRLDVDQEVIENLENLCRDLDRGNLKSDILIRLGAINPDLNTDMEVTNVKPCKSYLELAEVAEKLTQKGFAVMDVEPFKSSYHWCGQQTDHVFTVGPHGDLYTCYDALTDPDQKIGSISDTNNVQRNASYQKWITRDPFSISECRSCKLLPICLGGCTLSAWRNHNTYQAPGCIDSQKEVFKKSIKRQVKHGFADKHFDPFE